jgi:hypothetical protein
MNSYENKRCNVQMRIVWNCKQNKVLPGRHWLKQMGLLQVAFIEIQKQTLKRNI